MKKTIVIFFITVHGFFAFSQSDVSVGPEQKIIAEMKIPTAVKPGSSFTVEIKITKGNVSGLGRLHQYLPKGMTATQLENQGADFSFDNRNMKLIWLNLPPTPIIDIKYRITTDASLTSSKTLDGTFSYVENGRTKKYSIVPKEIRFDPQAPEEEAVAEVKQPEQTPVLGEPPTAPSETKTASIPPSPDETKPEEQPVKEKIIAEKTIEIPKQNPAEEQAPTTSSVANKKALADVTTKKLPAEPAVSSETTASASGLIFRIQIAAMNEKHYRRDGYFQRKFNIEQPVFTEEHEGLKKYSVGNYSSYNEARRKRDEILSNAEGAFVVAYKDGVRISVSEALELMKQK
ncbi:MAG: hypothetical protein JJE25_03160 [Bacteroidia bacterium]|nr:hypothetical protein [Bacteroidia bacterium]